MKYFIRINDLSVYSGNLPSYSGNLPSRALGLVIEWASMHREELFANWEMMKQELPINKIEPLK